MKRIACLAFMILLFSTLVIIVFAEEATFEQNEMGENNASFFLHGEYNEDVLALHQKLIDFGYYYLRAESPWSDASKRALIILQENIGEKSTGTVQNKEKFEEYLRLEHVIGRNLAIDTSDDWSDWMGPEYNVDNKTFNPFYALLPDDKIVGDYYTCSVEIEFRDVKASKNEDMPFRFLTQGSVDKAWNIGNIWSAELVGLTEAPENGIYQYKSTSQITEKNGKSEIFNLGFRCDYWVSGQFRVRNIKVEKGRNQTEWCSR